MPRPREDGPNQLEEQEVTRILELAASLQHRATGGKSGLTIRDVELAAAEAGIEPNYVRAASLLSSAEYDDAPAVKTLFGAPLVIHLALAVSHSKAALPKSELFEPLIQRALGTLRRVPLNNTLAWDATSGTQVTIVPEGKETRLTIDEDLGPVARTLFLGAAVVIGVLGGGLALSIGAALSAPAQLALALPGLFLAGSVLVARAAFARFYNRRRARLQRLVEELITQLARAGQSSR